MVVDLEALDRVILALDRLGYGSYADEVRAHRERAEREIDRLRADVEHERVGIDGLEITVRQMARELEEARAEVERLRAPRPTAIVEVSESGEYGPICHAFEDFDESRRFVREHAESRRFVRVRAWVWHPRAIGGAPA